jgi:hypothetical protein
MPYLKFKFNPRIFLYSIIHLIFCLCYPLSADTLTQGEISGINFLNFTGVDDYFTLNGESKIVVDNFSGTDEEKMVLRLTPRKSNPDGSVAGSAFLKMPFVDKKDGNYKFSTFFRFRITANNIFDGSGLIFVIHADTRKDKALGKTPNGMGYSGDYLRGFRSISPSLGIKFNTQVDDENDIDYNTIGTVLNGSLSPLYPPYGYPIAANNLNNGIPWNVWIDYDGNFLTIRSTQSPEFDLSTEHTKRPIDLRRILTQNISENKQYPEAYIGFTADPGFNPAYNDILEWHFRPYYKPFGDYCGDVPEDRPASCVE